MKNVITIHVPLSVKLAYATFMLSFTMQESTSEEFRDQLSVMTAKDRDTLKAVFNAKGLDGNSILADNYSTMPVLTESTFTDNNYWA